ncbi:hypothetical protein HK102_013246 [Quaeritorhiza haematococci]|nr:hypothetical protein HK102_013246 [Quaeritorhiza haematococci]
MVVPMSYAEGQSGYELLPLDWTVEQARTRYMPGPVMFGVLRHGTIPPDSEQQIQISRMSRNSTDSRPASMFDTFNTRAVRLFARYRLTLEGGGDVDGGSDENEDEAEEDVQHEEDDEEEEEDDEESADYTSALHALLQSSEDDESESDDGQEEEDIYGGNHEYGEEDEDADLDEAEFGATILPMPPTIYLASDSEDESEQEGDHPLFSADGQPTLGENVDGGGPQQSSTTTQVTSSSNVGSTLRRAFAIRRRPPPDSDVSSDGLWGRSWESFRATGLLDSNVNHLWSLSFMPSPDVNDTTDEGVGNGNFHDDLVSEGLRYLMRKRRRLDEGEVGR